MRAIEAGSQAMAEAMGEAARGAERAAEAAREAARQRAAFMGDEASEAELSRAGKAGAFGFTAGVAMPGHGGDGAMAAWAELGDELGSGEREPTRVDAGGGGAAARVLEGLGRERRGPRARLEEGEPAAESGGGGDGGEAAVPARRARVPRQLGGEAAHVAAGWVEGAGGAIVKGAEIGAALPPELRRFAPQFNDLRQVDAFLEAVDVADTSTVLGRMQVQQRRDAMAQARDTGKRRGGRRRRRR